MGGIFGVVSKKSCTLDVFFGVDYHSHLGTKRGGMAVYGPRGFSRAIHNIENTGTWRSWKALPGSDAYPTMSRSRS